jgi:hypothetical protein
VAYGSQKGGKAVDWLDAFQLKVRTQLLGAQEQGEPPQNIIEGSLRPDEYGTIERKPDHLRPLGHPGKVNKVKTLQYYLLRTSFCETDSSPTIMNQNQPLTS